MNSIITIAAAAFSLALAAVAEAQTSGVEAIPETGFNRSSADGGIRRWGGALGGAITLYGAPSANAEIVEILPKGTVDTNFGCFSTAGSNWCKVQSFLGSTRGFALAEALVPVPGPDGIIARGVDDSRQRARRKKFDQTGEIRCAQDQGQDLGRCKFGVARSGGGDATVAATFANGFSRLLYFVHGEFVSANPTMSGTGTDTEGRVEGGLHIIRVDDQRFEVPAAVLIAS